MSIINEVRGRRAMTAVSRSLLALALSLYALAGWAGGTGSEAAGTQITVYKTPNCGCCTLWVDHLEENGFEVEVHMVDDTRQIRSELGVPNQVVSCHTAVVGNYWVEGHVPASLISRLLEEHPDDVAGIAAPGMPLGSPGMEAPNASTYQVVKVDKSGTIEVYETVQGQKNR